MKIDPNPDHNLEADFERLTRCFEAIAQIKSPTYQRFTLNKIAPFHGIPRAEFRALYRIWQLEKFN